ncbi:hypothetical protein FRC06_007259, partial [Ceratobasidium sp. 370]
QSELKIQQFGLETDQWPLAEELNEALEVFEVLTNHFSAGSVPLVHEVLPKLLELKESLETMRDSIDISPVTRVGAQAALNVFDKYMDNMSICEVYFISLVMCPDVKLNWLRKHYDNVSVERICQMHNMSSQTFEAKMALGSWYNTPLLPDIEEVASVIAETM